MKLILIKIGKAFATIRRDGIIVGGRRVSGYFIFFFKSIFKNIDGEILFIEGGVGDSAFYRSHNQSEELNMHDIKSAVMIQDNPFLLMYLKKFKVFIFHRTIDNQRLRKFILEIKKLKKEIIFETDDLVFDAKFIQETDLYKNKMTAFEKLQYKKGVGEEILKDDYVKSCVTSTSYLAEILRKYGKKVFISKNKISNHELEIAENIIKNIPKPKDGYVRIGYFSGTYSHNKDFATITDALVSILEKYESAKLCLVGPLDTEGKLNKFSSQIERLSLAPRDRYYENVWKADINLAPLVAGDPFCESKSELKFFEPGILGIPTVAVSNQTFSEAIEDGVGGYLAGSKEEWIEKIGKLIEDEKLREEMGGKAREKVLRDYTNKNSHNEEYYNYLRIIVRKNEGSISAK